MILNLTNPEYSEIKYKVSKFPDGQQAVKIVAASVDNEDSDGSATIQSRFNSFKDLELIICATKGLRSLGIKHINLYVPYFLGGRSDRQFSVGEVNYLKEVVCPIINSLQFDNVIVMDGHSDVLEALITNYKKLTNDHLVHYALYSIYSGVVTLSHVTNRFNLVSPDAGALKKVYSNAESIGYKKEIIIASKHRDLTTGMITHTEVPSLYNVTGNDFIIIDDICDGGRTFVELAKAILSKRPQPLGESEQRHTRIFLVVTHGIFSAGFAELGKYFDGIFTTNSIYDIDREDLQKYNIKQIDLFS